MLVIYPFLFQFKSPKFRPNSGTFGSSIHVKQSDNKCLCQQIEF